jgi:hypothetical protein
MDIEKRVEKEKGGKSTNLYLIIAFAIIAYFLWTEHRAHVISALPYLLILLCPIIHVFLHRNHNKDVSDNGQKHHH